MTVPWFAVALLVSIPGLVEARDDRTFADSCVEPESGDVAGVVITFDPQMRRRAAFEWSDGALHGPIPATLRRSPHGGNIAVLAHTDAGVFRFDGHRTGRLLEGTLIEPWSDQARLVRLVEMRHDIAAHPDRACPAPSR